MTRVDLIHWNPRRPLLRGRAGRFLPFGPRVDNFGDLLGPFVIEEMLRRRGLANSGRSQGSRLLSVGSIMRLARNGDTVWGSGVNGKTIDQLKIEWLDVRAVRGPRTREILRARGIPVPPVFGDPALLLGVLWSRDEWYSDELSAAMCIVPNLNDWKNYDPKDPRVLDPRRPLDECLRRIASSEFVVGSSLHGIVVAEALGIPARLVRSASEPEFKYRDYYEGSGRVEFAPAATVDAAQAMGGALPPTAWDPEPLMSAFPSDLWADVRGVR